jgi:hypothetical protein
MLEFALKAGPCHTLAHRPALSSREGHSSTPVLRARSMKHAAFSLVFAASFYFADLARAQACSCVESAGVSEDLAASGSVFEGKVTRLRHEPKQHRFTATLRVLRRWKGEARTTIDVVTIDQGSLCGFGFERGKSYLLFTSEAEGTLSVSLCSRSKASESAAADFAELDRLAEGGPSAPGPGPGTPTEPAAPEAPAATTAPPVSPAPVPPPAAASAPTEPGRGGCAGCAVSANATRGQVATLALLLAAGFRRSRRRALNAPGSSGHALNDDHERRKAPHTGDVRSGNP